MFLSLLKFDRFIWPGESLQIKSFYCISPFLLGIPNMADLQSLEAIVGERYLTHPSDDERMETYRAQLEAAGQLNNSRPNNLYQNSTSGTQSPSKGKLATAISYV